MIFVAFKASEDDWFFFDYTSAAGDKKVNVAQIWKIGVRREMGRYESLTLPTDYTTSFKG